MAEEIFELEQSLSSNNLSKSKDDPKVKNLFKIFNYI